MGKNSGSGGRGNGGRRPSRRATAAAGGTAVAEAPQAPAAAPVAPALSGDRLLSASTVTRGEDETAYAFRTASGDRVRMEIGNQDGFIVFGVNGNTTRINMDQEERNAVSLRLLRHMREDARNRPDGFTYHASAAGGDGYQIQRAMAYEAVGMSRPFNANPGLVQYAVVRDGKMRPNMEALARREGAFHAGYNSTWAATKARYQRERKQNR